MEIADKRIENLFKQELDKIIISEERFEEIKSIVRLNSENKEKSYFSTRYIKAAAIIIVCLLLVSQRNIIYGVAQSIYQMFVNTVDERYVENANENMIKLNKELLVDGQKFIIKEYVVTNSGISIRCDFANETNTKIASVIAGVTGEFELDQTLLVKTEDGYIVENSTQNTDWYSKADELALNISYTNDDYKTIESQMFTIELDTSKIYSPKEISCNETINLGDKTFNVKSINLNSWYMEINLDYCDEIENITIWEDDKEIPILSGTTNDNIAKLYCGLPSNSCERIKISLNKAEGYIDLKEEK